MRIFSTHIPRRRALDATRLALQSAVAAAAMFSLMRSLGLREEFVGVLSAVLVVQPTIGSTLSEASQHIAATVVGCLVGVTCLVALPSGYGTAGALAVSSLVMHLLAAFRPQWRSGVVAAVAVALGSESDAILTAFDRSLAIGIGVVVGSVVTLLLWPDRAVKRAERRLRSALRACAERLDVTVKATRGEGSGEADKERTRFHQNFADARSAAKAARFSDTDLLEKKVQAVERFYNSVLFLNRVAEERAESIVDGSGLAAAVETVRSCGCEIATRLADGDGGLRPRLEKIRAALEAIRGDVAREGRDPGTRILQNALAFGLHQVRDSLETLAELYGAGE